MRNNPFQERILDALSLERTLRNHRRNLVIAATGTGKTVISAFDYKSFCEEKKKRARLLFIAHRQEILHQALATFRNVLWDHNFGEMLVGPYQANRLDYLFCSVGMLANRRLWDRLGREFYDYIVVDEAHHGTAASYRPVFDHFDPEILLGLTATPERMDGGNVAADFGNRFAAEIRLPEALEEKLLCPFHYFAVADPVSISADHFWKNGRYDERELEKVYTGVHVLAQQRLDVICSALKRYEPNFEEFTILGGPSCSSWMGFFGRRKVGELLLKEEVYSVAGAAIEVHRELGSGFLEAVYQEAMEIELRERDIPFEAQKPLPVSYKGRTLSREYFADLVCHGRIIVELKAIDRLSGHEEAQVLNYLKATGLKVGVLINFGSHGKLEWKRFVR